MPYHQRQPQRRQRRTVLLFHRRRYHNDNNNVVMTMMMVTAAVAIAATMTSSIMTTGSSSSSSSSGTLFLLSSSSISSSISSSLWLPTVHGFTVNNCHHSRQQKSCWSLAKQQVDLFGKSSSSRLIRYYTEGKNDDYDQENDDGSKKLESSVQSNDENIIVDNDNDDNNNNNIPVPPPPMEDSSSSPVFIQTVPLLLDWIQQYGHPNIPLKNPGGKQCITLRRLHIQNKLQPEEVEWLSTIGFHWHSLEDVYRYGNFEELFKRMMNYEADHPDSNFQIPKKLAEDPELGAFVTGIRRLGPQGVRPQDERRLNDVGFVWVSQRQCGSKFMIMYRGLAERIDAEEGGITSILQKDPSVVQWVQAQQSALKRGALSQTRVHYMGAMFGDSWTSIGNDIGGGDDDDGSTTTTATTMMTENGSDSSSTGTDTLQP